MRRLGFKLNRVMTSGHKRAIQSAKLFREGYFTNDDQNVESLPIDLKLNCHEISGCHMGGKIYPGLNQEQMKALCNDLTISDD